MQSKFLIFLSGFLCVVNTPLVMAAQKSVMVVDQDFPLGATEAAWKADGSEIAVQGAEGVAIRDSKTLRLKRFINRKIIERTSHFQSPPSLVTWLGDNLVFAEKSFTTYFPRETVLLESTDGHVVARFRSATVTSDRQSLYSTDRKGNFRILNFATQRWSKAHLPKLRVVAEKSNNSSDYSQKWSPEISFSPDGKYAADQQADGQMRLWDTQSKKIIGTLKDKVLSNAYPQVMAPLAWSPDGTKVATLGEDPDHSDIYIEEGPNDGSINEHAPVIKIWNAQTGTLLQWFKVHEYDKDAHIQLTWLNDNQLIVGSPINFLIRSVSEKKSVLALNVYEISKPVTPYALAHDGSRVFVSNRFVPLRKPNAVESSNAIPAASLIIKDLAWSRDSKYLAASFDNYHVSGLQIWGSDTRTDNFELENLDFSFSPMRIGWTRSNRVWSSNFNNVTFRNGRKQWQQENWKAPVIHPAKNPQNDPFSDSPSNGLFALSDDKTRLQLPAGFGNEIYRLRPHKKSQQLLYKNAQSGGFREFLSPDERFLNYYDGVDGNISLKMFDLKVPHRVLFLPHAPLKDADGNDIWKLTPIFSGNGKRMAWGGRMWSLPAGKLLKQHYGDGEALAYNHSGTVLLKNGAKGLNLFSTKSGQSIQHIALDGHVMESGVNACAWSPDDRFIAITQTNVIQIYDVKQRRFVASLYAWPSATQQKVKGNVAKAPEWLFLKANGEHSGTKWAKSLIREIN